MNDKIANCPSAVIPEVVTDDVISAILAAPIDSGDDVIREREYNDDIYD